MIDFIVCVPTFRRPEQLFGLIGSLAVQRDVEPFDVIIGNNDQTSVTSIFPTDLGRIRSTKEIFVTTRGVVEVRNALVKVALEHEVEWIAWLDDDQTASEIWLSELLRVGRRHGADLVGGPVAKLPRTQTFWSTAATCTDFLPTGEGSVPMLNEAGNLLISTQFVRSVGRPLFNPSFGRSGGEDYELFRFASRAKARMCWAPLAAANEIVPEDRLTFRGFVWRSYSTGSYQMRVDKAMDGRTTVLFDLCRGLAIIPLASIRTFLRSGDVRLAMGRFVRDTAGFAGRLAALVGVRAERYGM